MRREFCRWAPCNHFYFVAILEARVEKNVLKKILRFWFREKSGGLEGLLGYNFKDPKLLAHSLIHRSWLAGKDAPYWENNERLEFLGDSVLNMLVTEYLYKTFPELPEGELSKRKSAIVSGHALAQTSTLWNLGEFVRIDKGEARMGGRLKESILADAFEAVIGAVYLDGGLAEARAVLERFHFPRIGEILSGPEFVNYKSELLEYMQGHGLSLPEYRVAAETGPEHLKVFEIEVILEGVLCGRGVGTSKKRAEQDAARKALEFLTSETDAEPESEPKTNEEWRHALEAIRPKVEAAMRKAGEVGEAGEAAAETGNEAAELGGEDPAEEEPQTLADEPAEAEGRAAPEGASEPEEDAP